MLHGSGHFSVRQSVAQGTEGVPSSPIIHDAGDAWQHAAATRYQIHFGPVVHFLCGIEGVYTFLSQFYNITTPCGVFGLLQISFVVIVSDFTLCFCGLLCCSCNAGLVSIDFERNSSITGSVCSRLKI